MTQNHCGIDHDIVSHNNMQIVHVGPLQIQCRVGTSWVTTIAEVASLLQVQAATLKEPEQECGS